MPHAVVMADEEHARPSITAGRIFMEVGHAEPGPAVVDIVVEQGNGCLLLARELVDHRWCRPGAQLIEHVSGRQHQDIEFLGVEF
ncbi:hypothetical protein D3C87_1802540 [compost metagenome]